jgi:bifunctional UDP-N-acetylglucosamine pyrophosphorylase / glucosamine-1-phosphate N-acetyltransferase
LSTDVVLYPGTHLQGETVVASGAELGPSTQLSDCTVGAHAAVTATIGRNADIGDHARVGPWAYLPPGTKVASGFVTGPCFTGSGDPRGMP